MKNDASLRDLKLFYDRALYFVSLPWGSVQAGSALLLDFVSISPNLFIGIKMRLIYV